MTGEQPARRDARAFAIVASGGAIGGVGRYVLGVYLPQLPTSVVSLSTLINVLGSLILGLAVELIIGSRPAKSSLRLFLTAGVCGGFTTAAAYTPETVRLFEEQDFTRAVLYAFMSIVLASLAATAGAKLGGRLSRGIAR